jgi:hypothetical protein
MAASAASIPFLVLARKSASADIGPFLKLARDSASGDIGPVLELEKSASALISPCLTSTCRCLLKGTKISTPSGDRLVQELQIGDEVQTLAGPKVIKWIGYNKFTKEEGRAWQDSVMPIRVARFAIDDRTPSCDLYLSPQHCIFINEVLIPVIYLVNETSITEGAPANTPALEYYHIELDTHEVIYAEGALVESYDGWNREAFSNFVQYERLYGVAQSEMKPFARILKYDGRRQELKGLVRSLISYVADARDPIQIAYDQLAKRAETMLV